MVLLACAYACACTWLLTAVSMQTVTVSALDDGQALTPPMGWSSWYAFGADINETKVVGMADKMVKHGLRDAGYTFVNLDDAWMSPMRDRYGNLQGDVDRFPSGMKWLATQLHARGLKLGLYGCVGVRTCLGFPGQFEHEYQDAATLASWGVDWWKMDNCWQKWATVEMYSGALATGKNQFPSNGAGVDALLTSLTYGLNIRGLSTEGEDAHPIHWQNLSGLPLATPDRSPTSADASPRGHQIQHFEAFKLFGEALKATGRNITYSICPLIAGCDPSVWKYYKGVAHTSMNQCVQTDNTDTWESFLYHIDDNNRFPARADAAGPGYWNDLDFLMVGYKELKKWEDRQTLQEYRSQFSLFAILAAPLMFSADIRGTQNGTYTGHNGKTHSTYNGWTDELQAILLNKEVIAVSQDALGKQGRLVNATQATNATIQVYSRDLAGGHSAVAVLNLGSVNVTSVHVTWAEAGVPPTKKVLAVHDLWGHRDVCAPPSSCGEDTGFTVPLLQTHDTALYRLTLV